MIHNGGWEGGKNGGRMDCLEKMRGGEMVGGWKNTRIRQTSLPYIHISLCKWYESTYCSTREMNVIPHFHIMSQKHF